MPSAINPSVPLDGQPAIKADLRNNLLAARDEINALEALTEDLPPDSFPDLLNLGGTKRAGGVRAIFRQVNTTTNLAQSDSGIIVIHNGAGAATWGVPALLQGTIIPIENEGGAITFNILDGQAFRGGLTLAADASGAVLWLPNGRVVLSGTA